MKQTNNRGVAQCWGNNEAARSSNGQFTTDGKHLFSYNLVIGITENGKKVVFNYTNRGGNYVSVTTSTHVGFGMYHAELRNPPKKSGNKITTVIR